MVSSGSVLLVALDQFIVFKLDPFGVRRILTKSRRILISLLSWITMLVVATCVVMLMSDSPTARFYFVNLSAIFTGVFYTLVYRAIARKSPHGNSQVRKGRRTGEFWRRTPSFLEQIWSYPHFQMSPALYFITIKTNLFTNVHKWDCFSWHLLTQ